MPRRPRRLACILGAALLGVALLPLGTDRADAEPRQKRHGQERHQVRDRQERPRQAQTRHAQPRRARSVSTATPAPPATPTDPAQQLQETERSREASLEAARQAADRARTARAEEQRLAETQVTTAARLHEAEALVSAATERVDALSRQQEAAESRLVQQGRQMQPLLPVAVRLGQFPAETLLAAPIPAEDAVRGLLVLRGLARQMERDATALRAEQAAARKLRSAVGVELVSLRQAQAEQARQSQALDGQIAASRATRRAAEDANVTATRRAADAAARANNLRGVIASIEAEQRRQDAEQRRQQEAERRRQDAEDQKAQREAQAAAARQGAAQQEQLRQEQARQQQVKQEARRQQDQLRPASLPAPNPARTPFTVPVAGQLVRGWGQRIEGGSSNGVAYRAAPGARVVAPCAGRVVFAGPFRSFGPMVILDCGGGFHMVLAGLDRLDAQVGHPAQAGEPVGLMSASGNPTLYMELRRGGQPVNPAPFLRSRG